MSGRGAKNVDSSEREAIAMTAATSQPSEKLEIRDYEPARDREDVITCVAGLQDYERSLDPDLPPGAQVARRYVDAMMQRCRAYQGRILVAAQHGTVVGFLCILARVPEQQVDEKGRPHAMVGELYLAPEQRSQGMGRRLLEEGETFARDRGAQRLRVQVLAANGIARSLYASAGFHERLIELEKRLS